jgi:hypothetical protein
MKGKTLLFILITFILNIGISCKDNVKSKPEKIVKEWIGKTIIFPSITPCFPLPGNAVYPINISDASYKILLYVDSTGCTNCKFQMYKWKQIIKEADSILPNAINFKFFFFPKNEKDLLRLLKKDGFDYYPFYIDKEDELNRLNRLPSDENYQCFLLDNNNKVLSIGNPTNNPNIWNLYKKIITGEMSDTLPITTVEVEQTKIELKDLQTGKTSEAVFVLKNTGSQPLVIQMVNASCGCTVPEWDKQPIAPGKRTEIKVKITPEEKGYFSKTVTVYGNMETGRIVLKVSGMV